MRKNVILTVIALMMSLSSVMAAQFENLGELVKMAIFDA